MTLGAQSIRAVALPAFHTVDHSLLNLTASNNRLGLPALNSFAVNLCSSKW